MPYIKQEDRQRVLKNGIESLPSPQTAGEFNYVVTLLSLLYIEDKGQNYQNYNDLLGALEGVKLELYRRQIAPYEDIKIEENGDV